MTDSATATVSTAQPATMGEAAEASKAATSASASSPTSPPAASPDFKTLLGDFANDPTFKDFKDIPSLAKSYKETKSLVGQKLGIPGADATPESQAAFYKAMGVPDAPEGYDLKAPDALPDNLKEYYTNDILKEFAVKAKQLNLTPAQVKGLQDWDNEKTFKTLDGIKAEKAASEDNFDKMATTAWGDKKVEALQAARASMEEHIPKEILATLVNAPNEYLIAMAQLHSGLIKKYAGKEDRVGKEGGSPLNQSPAQMREEASKLMALPEYTSPFAKGKDEHERVNKQVKDLYARIASAK